MCSTVEQSNATVVQATMAAALDITKNGFTLTQANGSNVTFQLSPKAILRQLRHKAGGRHAAAVSLSSLLILLSTLCILPFCIAWNCLG